MGSCNETINQMSLHSMIFLDKLRIQEKISAFCSDSISTVYLIHSTVLLDVIVHHHQRY